MKPDLLDSQSIIQALQELPGWSGDERGLNTRLKFIDFPSAMRFMQACVPEIERLNHHPVWTNKYNTLEIHLDTFDAGNKVTVLDKELALSIDRLVRQRGSEFGIVHE